MTHINPADCKPDDVYLINVTDTESVDNPMVGMRRKNHPLPGHPWETFRGWHRDSMVEVLHRMVPERDEATTVSVRSEADELDWLADEIEQITDDVDAPVSAASLREMAAEQRADDAAQRVEDALVEKTAQAMRAAWLSAPVDRWGSCDEDDRDDWRKTARAALAVFREEVAL